MSKLVLRTGDFAYLDSIVGGLVPVKVLRIMQTGRYDGLGSYDVRYIVTASRRGYPKSYRGDASGRYVVPRAAVLKPRGVFFPRIRPYTIEADKP